MLSVFDWIQLAKIKLNFIFPPRTIKVRYWQHPERFRRDCCIQGGMVDHVPAAAIQRGALPRSLQQASDGRDEFTLQFVDSHFNVPAPHCLFLLFGILSVRFHSDTSDCCSFTTFPGMWSFLTGLILNYCLILYPWSFQISPGCQIVNSGFILQISAVWSGIPWKITFMMSLKIISVSPSDLDKSVFVRI